MAALVLEQSQFAKAFSRTAAELKVDAADEVRYKTSDVFGKKPVTWRSGKYKGKVKKVTVNVADLYPSQGHVEAAIVQLYYAGKRRDKKGGPDIVEIDGKQVIADGHHRVTSDIIKGKKRIKANFYPIVKGVNDDDDEEVAAKLSSAQFDKLVARITRVVLAQQVLKARRHLMRIEPGRPTVKMRRARRRMRTLLEVFFAKALKNVTKSLAANYEKLCKAKRPDDIAAMAYDSIDWGDMVDDAEQILTDIAKEGGLVGIGQLNIDDQELFDSVNQGAADYAEERAAEMVGMRRTPSGRLVNNPDARWAISETTRDDLRDIITNAFENDTPWKELVDQIKASGMFSSGRAEMVAHTEAARAQVEGNLTAWRESGVVESVNWVTSGDHDVDDECDEYEEGSPYLVDEVPDCPAHPRCECALVPAGVQGEE